MRSRLLGLRTRRCWSGLRPSRRSGASSTILLRLGLIALTRWRVAVAALPSAPRLRRQLVCLPLRRRRSMTLIGRSIGCRRFRRSCCWPSASGRDRRMRFQDAAPDARAVVYAGIQADPLVARAAALLADATQGERILARAVMNGTSTDAAAWRAMFPTLFAGAGATGDGAAVARREAILAACLEGAERGEQARQQFRGAIVESVTEILARRRPAAGSIPTAV